MALVIAELPFHHQLEGGVRSLKGVSARLPLLDFLQQSPCCRRILFQINVQFACFHDHAAGAGEFGKQDLPAISHLFRSNMLKGAAVFADTVDVHAALM